MTKRDAPGVRGADWLAALRRGAPYAIVLALGIGAALFAGANLSQAYPSAQRPFGWPGTANFDNAVAMVRPELLLVASIPAIVWGARTLSRLEPDGDGQAGMWTVVGVDLLLLWGGVLAGALIGKWEASATPDDALWGFTVAHGMLAAAFYCVGLLLSVATRRYGLPLAMGAWAFLAVIVRDLSYWQAYRQAGYFELRLGHFPSWFYVVQGLSPVEAYRGILILWRKGFRDGLEHAVLDGATLPSWMTAQNFVALMAVLWVILPLSIASLVWHLRARHRKAAPTGQEGFDLAHAMQVANQMGADEIPVTATAKDRAAGNAPATRDPDDLPLGATGQSAPSTTRTGGAASQDGDGDSH